MRLFAPEHSAELLGTPPRLRSISQNAQHAGKSDIMKVIFNLKYQYIGSVVVMMNEGKFFVGFGFDFGF